MSHILQRANYQQLDTVLDTDKRNMRKSTNGGASHIHTHPIVFPNSTLILIIKLRVHMIPVTKEKQRVQWQMA